MNCTDEIKGMTDSATALLREMIAIKSVSFCEQEACSHISAWLNSKGIRHERIGNNIVAEHITDPSAPALMLCAHIDTVAPAPEYSFDPYIPDQTEAAKRISAMTGRELQPEEVVAGLGSNDDGASAVAMIAAFIYFVESSRKQPECHEKINLTLALTCEEERSGQGGMRSLWHKRLSHIRHAIVGEPTQMKAATSERGLLVIDACAYGASGHAARNEGINAIYIAIEDIAKIRGHAFGKVSRMMGKVNLNVTQINAGTAHNVIPDKCSFVIDIRPTDEYSNAEILNELQSICKSKLNARNLENRSSATREGSPLLEAATFTGTETFSSPTTSDWMRIGCDAIKMGPGDSARSHKADEFVLVSEIEDGIRGYINFIKAFGRIAGRA